MPLYTFEHPETKEVIEVLQRMNDVHEYFDEKGVQWTRQLSVPHAITNPVGTINPNSPHDFVSKTKNTNMTVGDMWDLSKELSEKRKEKNGGHDEVKDKAVKAYEKKTKKPHPHAKS